MSASTPTIIAGRYELQRRLAQGGMAEVWLAVDLTLDRKVAVKWLKPTLASDPIVAERFRREAIAAASLNHPNIVAVHDVFEQDGRQAVVMQLVDGKSLRQLLDTQKRLSPELTCHIGTCVAKALDHAHEAGFVHRDVKPGNIMITPDGRVLLTDFGIAKGLRGDGTDDLTSDNIMMGTAKYLSPEQVRGKRLDGRADLYSLGLVLYECLAGRVPFLGETDADTALARLQRDPTDLNRLRATLPTRLVEVIHDLLARNPDHRPATGVELAEELEQASREGAPEIDDTDPARSPVAPFAAGRLVRAPSDLRGRARDRDRGKRAPTPPRGKTARESPSRPTRRPEHRQSAPIEPVEPGPASSVPIDPILHSGSVPAVPGEPAVVSGRVPVQQPATPATSAVRDRTGAPNPTRTRGVTGEATPSSGLLRGATAKGMGQRRLPTLTVIGGLVAIAVCVAVILWATLIYGGGESASTTTVLPADGAAADTATGDTATADDAPDDATAAEAAPAVDAATDATDPAAVDAAADAQSQIVAALAYDPEGDGEENDELAEDALADGDPTTAWRTVCYSDRYMGAKRGVGIVVTLDTPVAAPISVEVADGPYQLEFFGVDDDAVPTDFAGWGERFDRSFDVAGGTVVSATPPAPVRHVLVLLNELGTSTTCSDDNPYRGGLAEIDLVR